HPSSYEEGWIAGSSPAMTRWGAASFDHLVGGDEQLVRHGEAEHPRGLGVDDELELARLHDRQIRGLRALEDAAGIDPELTPCIGQARAIAHQPADFDILAPHIYRRDRVARRQLDRKRDCCR